MIGNFGKKNSTNYLLLLLYAILLKANLFVVPLQKITNNGDGYLYTKLIDLLNLQNNKILVALLSIVLLYTQALQISSIINRNKLVQKYSLYAAMSYLLITSLLLGGNGFSAAMVANSLLLYGFNLLLNLQNTTSAKQLLFSIGITISFITLLYNYSFAYMLVAIIALSLYRTFKLHEYAILIVGYGVPFYFLYSIQYLTNHVAVQKFGFNWKIVLPKLEYFNWWLLGISIIGGLTILGLLTVQNQSGKMNIQARKSWKLFFVYILVSIIMAILANNYAAYITLLVPAAAFIGAFFTYVNNTIVKTITHWVVFTLAILVVYFLT